MNNVTRIVRRIERLKRDAKAAGIVLALDADLGSIRVMTKEEYEAAEDDIRQAGVSVSLDDSCGTAGSKVSGMSCNYGNT